MKALAWLCTLLLAGTAGWVLGWSLWDRIKDLAQPDPTE